MKILFTLLLIIRTLHPYGQTTKHDFSQIDNKVKTIQAGSVDSLSIMLCSSYKTQIEKVRSIFKWITENIEYDIVGYHNIDSIYFGLFRPTISPIDSIVQKDYNERIVEKVLKEKKAICDGYSRLFKTLCDKANIQSVIVSGYIRWYSDPIGAVTDRGHAWNAVFINNKWQLLDPTWASGHVDSEVKKFSKKYNDFYFLTPPIQFFNDHYPSDPKWGLISNLPNRKIFYYYPFLYQDFYKSHIISYKPTNGLIELTIVNKKVRIELETGDEEKTLYIIEYPSKTDTTNSSFLKDTLSIKQVDQKNTSKYKISGNKIYWDYELQSDKTERLDIVYNDKLILGYYIKMYK